MSAPHRYLSDFYFTTAQGGVSARRPGEASSKISRYSLSTFFYHLNSPADQTAWEEELIAEAFQALPGPASIK